MKLVKILLLASMVILFTACGGGGSSNDDPIESTQPNYEIKASFVEQPIEMSSGDHIMTVKVSTIYSVNKISSENFEINNIK